MTPNPYLYEKIARVHHDELLREAEQHRLLAHLPQRHPHQEWNIVARFRAFLAGLTSSSAKLEQPVRTLTGQL
jgi:hypothetical protein